MVTAWTKPGDYQEKFISGGQESVNLVVNDLLQAIEVATEERLKYALDLHENKLLKPEFIQGAAAGISHRSIAEVLRGAHRLYTGNGRFGLAAQLRQIQSPIADRTEAQFRAALKAMEALAAPLEKTLLTDRAAVSRAYDECKKLEVMLKVEMASALGVTLTFNSHGRGGVGLFEGCSILPPGYYGSMIKGWGWAKKTGEREASSRASNRRWLLPVLLATGVALFPLASAEAKTTITRTNYHGWLEAYVVSNGKAEAVVVPTIGRVMQFGFAGEDGVFWENRALDGRIVDGRPLQWSSGQWVNFGGDKTWPSPESDWGQFTGRKSWRPPPAFDGMPADARVEGDTLVLSSPVDPFYGLRTRRRIRLHPGKPEMTITTTYERVSGEPAKVGVWVITQLKEPAGLFAPWSGKSAFTNGYTLLGKEHPPSVKLTNGLVSLFRNTNAAHKIGLDADSLLWVGAKHTLRIDSPRRRGAEYPDKGSSTEIYTNPDPLQYIELETLGPLRVMKTGDTIEHRNTYILKRRSHPTPEAEARAEFRR